LNIVAILRPFESYEIYQLQFVARVCKRCRIEQERKRRRETNFARCFESNEGFSKFL